MTEHATVHEPVQTDTETNVSGENIGATIDRSAAPLRNPLMDAKRYRKRAQAAEKEVEEAKQTLAAREDVARARADDRLASAAAAD